MVSKTQFKLGLDFGRGFLKLLISDRFNKSVNKVYYLWVAEVPESLYNFRTIFEHEQMKILISNHQVSFTADQKAASILPGIMLGRYPCVWCNWDKKDQFQDNNPLLKRNTLQHMEMLKRLRLNSKVIHKNIPNIVKELSSSVDKLLMDSMEIWNIPELHLLLGIGQKLYDSILPESLNFNPNNPCVIALNRFSDVVKPCFGSRIRNNYQESIQLFKEAYKLTGLSCTVKVHCLCRHVKTFIDEFLPQGFGIGAVSEQPFEISHSKFRKSWEQQYKCNKDSPSYSKNILVS